MPDFPDADLTHEWARRYRIPLLTSVWPQAQYEVALAVPAVDDRFSTLIWPDEHEAAIISSAIEYRKLIYTPHTRAKMAERPLDDSGWVNTVVLGKTVTGWLYRSASWDGGLGGRGYEPSAAGLIALLDRAVSTSLTMSWSQWMDQHPEIFTDAVSA